MEGQQHLDKLGQFIAADEGLRWVAAVHALLNVHDEWDLASLMEQVEAEDAEGAMI